MKPANSSVELFDRTAEAFAQGTDELIRGGAYVRGRLFSEMSARYIKAGGRVLDYGCGPGRIALSLARSGYTVVGVDQSPGMIAAARAASPAGLPAEFHELERSAELFEPGVWDGIVCSSVIEYIEQPEATLRDFFGALRPGGVLIISYANAGTLWRRLAQRRREDHPHLNFQYNVWTWREAATIFDRAGFERISGPRFFESPFDKYPALRFLSGARPFGNLGLVVLRARK